MLALGREMASGEPCGSLALHCEVECPVQSPLEKTLNKVLYNSSRPFASLCATLGYLMCWDGPQGWVCCGWWLYLCDI